MSQQEVRRDSGTWFSVLAFALLALCVSRLQPRLAGQLHEIKETDDVYPFPPPALRLATLGYVGAATDVLWGKLLVENGSHWAEHRAFPDLDHYLDAIIALEPTYHPLYEFVDSLLCYRPPTHGSEADAIKARAYLETGTKALPNDPEIWMHYGQFVAFMGPTYLTRDEDKKAWRREGALALDHAVELGADVDLGVAASAMLDSRLGERAASIRFLERAYALTDDPAEREQISARLEMLHATEIRDRSRHVLDTIESTWHAKYPFLDRGMFMLIAPDPAPLRCVGPGAPLDPTCARDWDPFFAR